MSARTTSSVWKIATGESNIPPMSNSNPATSVGVVGLGYVGLPLAVIFGKKFPTIGYDLSTQKVRAYREKTDPTGEVARQSFDEAKLARWTNDPKELAAADVIVVAVPTPIDNARMPDFTPLRGASETVGANMRRSTTVVYESTVYPGLTEEFCVPILERASGLKWKQDFSSAIRRNASIPATRCTR